MPITPIVIVVVFLIACFIVGIIVLKFVGDDNAAESAAHKEKLRTFNHNNLD